MAMQQLPTEIHSDLFQDSMKLPLDNAGKRGKEK
jgi:hypothetical protein